MPKLTELTKAFNVTAGTLRNWSAEFADHLSPSANPPKGVTRSYSQDDAAVLALVSMMRAENQPYAAIHAALADGATGDYSPPPDDMEEEGPEEEERERALVARLTATVAKFEGQLEAVTEERDHLRDKLDEAHDRINDLTERATAAETRASMLGDLLEDKKGTVEEPGAATERPWWKFWG